MKNIVVRPSGPLIGKISVPGDKSISHRAVLLGAIASGRTTIQGLLLGEDILAMIQAFRSCGIHIEVSNQKVVIEGRGLDGLKKPETPIDCGNSGTAMRLLMGVLAGQNFSSVLVGDASLSNRPMDRVAEPLRKMGASIELSRSGTPPVKINPVPKLSAVEWNMPVASAQVKSAILLSGLYSEGIAKVIEPSLTRDHTEIMLKQFGSNVEMLGNTVQLKGGKQLQGQNLIVPGDFSSAAFFVLSALLHPESNLLIERVGANPNRTGMEKVLNMACSNRIQVVNFSRLNDGENVADLHIRGTNKMQEIKVEKTDIPKMIDEIPLLGLAAAFASGKSSIRHCEELRYKESDRIDSVTQGLRQLGIQVEEKSDGWVIKGGVIRGGIVDSFKDHRIAMGFAVAGARAKEKVLVKDVECIETSFPEFESIAKQAGIDLEVIEAENC